MRRSFRRTPKRRPRRGRRGRRRGPAAAAGARIAPSCSPCRCEVGCGGGGLVLLRHAAVARAGCGLRDVRRRGLLCHAAVAGAGCLGKGGSYCSAMQPLQVQGGRGGGRGGALLSPIQIAFPPTPPSSTIPLLLPLSWHFVHSHRPHTHFTPAPAPRQPPVVVCRWSTSPTFAAAPTPTQATPAARACSPRPAWWVYCHATYIRGTGHHEGRGHDTQQRDRGTTAQYSAMLEMVG